MSMLSQTYIGKYYEGSQELSVSTKSIPGQDNDSYVIDGKPFELYTTLEDKLALYKSAQSAWIFFFFIFMIMAVLMKSFIYSALAITCLIIVIVYWFPIYKIIKERRTRED